MFRCSCCISSDSQHAAFGACEGQSGRSTGQGRLGRAESADHGTSLPFCEDIQDGLYLPATPSETTLSAPWMDSSLLPLGQLSNNNFLHSNIAASDPSRIGLNRTKSFAHLPESDPSHNSVCRVITVRSVDSGPISCTSVRTLRELGLLSCGAQLHWANPTNALRAL